MELKWSVVEVGHHDVGCLAIFPKNHHRPMWKCVWRLESTQWRLVDPATESDFGEKDQKHQRGHDEVFELVQEVVHRRRCGDGFFWLWDWWWLIFGVKEESEDVDHEVDGGNEDFVGDLQDVVGIWMFVGEIWSDVFSAKILVVVLAGIWQRQLVWKVLVELSLEQV